MPSVDRRGSRLLVTDALGHDLVKARLPLPTGYPRALLALLEGLAPYFGAVLCTVTSAATDIKQIERRYRQPDNEGR
jgi:hypothetical protein